MAITLIIASFLIVGIIIRAILIRYTGWGSIRKSVSWEYVNNEVGRPEYCKYKQCTNCDLEPGKLNWFKFRTSYAAWRNLAGAEGFYSMCPDCKIVVEDIITAMN
jgi:hypothetical protein